MGESVAQVKTHRQSGALRPTPWCALERSASTGAVGHNLIGVIRLNISEVELIGCSRWSTAHNFSAKVSEVAHLHQREVPP